MSRSSKRRLWVGAGLVLGFCLILLVVSSQVCLTAWVFHGVTVSKCPTGTMRQTVAVSVPRLVRGSRVEVRVSAFAHYSLGGADEVRSAPKSRFSPELFLVVDGKEQPLPLATGWKRRGHSRYAEVDFPLLDDGNYVLRAKVSSSLGDASADLALPLLSPAKVHVMLDRPLYEPGHTVRFRAVVLRAKDLVPLEKRPGVWVVTDPAGEVVLEEHAPAGPWGVVAGSLPLDRGAPTGTWHVAWRSGEATDDVAFQVEPFTLPRFRVEAQASKPFYRAGDRPVVRGAVTYSSGAPVSQAELTFTWSTQGAWPPPRAWTDGSALPPRAKANPQGRFTLELPAVPHDLQGQATLLARISAVDSAGDRVEGTASVLLSEDPIQVSAVTELGDGLAEGFNNRLYLRATSADGQVLEGIHLTVRRAWEPTDPGVNAKADVDGVSSLQIDPGAPVNVVVPPMPFRPPAPQPAVSLNDVRDLLTDEDPRLSDQVAMERWLPPLSRCAVWASGDDEVTVGLRVAASGAIRLVTAPEHRLGRCLAKTLEGLALPAGGERLYALSYGFDDSELPQLEAQLEGVTEPSDQLSSALSDAVLGLRDCYPPSTPSGRFPLLIEWRSRAKAREVALSWLPNRDGARAFSASVLDCARSRLSGLLLPENEPASNQGLVRIDVSAPTKYEAMRPQATTFLGYEFVVEARRGDAVLGKTKLVMQRGDVPPLRMRASPLVVRPGEKVNVELFRGPDFTGDFPEKLTLHSASRSIKSDLEPEKRVATFTIPSDWEGWAETKLHGARAVIFVQPAAQLTVGVSAEKPRYAPGELAHLNVTTSIAGKGSSAAVGLFGVDETLAQLVPLPGADELVRVRPAVQAQPAFTSIDAQAVTMGRIRGANATAAAILKVTALPTAAELDRPLALHGRGTFDPTPELVERFYEVLGELHQQARRWEQSAPAAERMTPRRMAELWDEALSACEQRKLAVTDAYGRRLRLSILPSDLLALVDPRQVVINATRLPEDIENWSQFVARAKP